MTPALLHALLTARQDKQPVVLVTEQSTGAQALLDADGQHRAGALTLSLAERAAAQAALAADRSGLLPDLARELFTVTQMPPTRLLLIGAVHVAQMLAPMATLAGYAVTVIDPREPFASPARFPDTALVHDWPDDAVRDQAPDARTAIITLPHDPKLDNAGLIAALEGPAFYIGALGSRKTHAKRRAALLEEGVAESAIDRIHAPLGLAIGAKTPAEIAVSALAQVTGALRGIPTLAPPAISRKPSAH
jgi:xanthine dehydrogenase accessory factor